jgi:hypothetical protein
MQCCHHDRHRPPHQRQKLHDALHRGSTGSPRLALAPLAPATILPPLNDTQGFPKWLLKVQAILHVKRLNGITNQNTESLALESLSSELYMLLINCLNDDMCESYIQGGPASFANQGILMLHDLISMHQSTSSPCLVSVFTRFLKAHMLPKLYIGTACHSDMTSPSRLPSIQETCVSAAKSTQPVNIDTSHIGIANSGATDHFFREKSYFLTYTPVHGKFIMMSNGASIPVLGMGTVSLTINGIPVKLIQCYYTPGLRASLYSLRRYTSTRMFLPWRSQWDGPHIWPSLH